MVAVELINGKGELVHLTKDDQDFRGIHTNLGALGILATVTFQAVPLFKVRGQQISIPTQDMPDKIVDLVRQHDWANLYWFSENNQAILHVYDKVDPLLPGKKFYITLLTCKN